MIIAGTYCRPADTTAIAPEATRCAERRPPDTACGVDHQHPRVRTVVLAHRTGLLDPDDHRSVKNERPAR